MVGEGGGNERGGRDVDRRSHCSLDGLRVVDVLTTI